MNSLCEEWYSRDASVRLTNRPIVMAGSFINSNAATREEHFHAQENSTIALAARYYSRTRGNNLQSLGLASFEALLLRLSYFSDKRLEWRLTQCWQNTISLLCRLLLSLHASDHKPFKQILCRCGCGGKLHLVLSLPLPEEFPCRYLVHVSKSDETARELYFCWWNRALNYAQIATLTD